MIMLLVEVLPEVYNEMEAARSWYDNKLKGLGSRFLDEVDRAMDAIIESPNIWTNYSVGTKRFILHRFPFSIIYRHNDIKIQILALMHFKKKPGYWKDRVQKTP